jgi:hypothetical protein
MRDELLYLAVIRESCQPSPYFKSPPPEPVVRTPVPTRGEKLAEVARLFENDLNYLKLQRSDTPNESAMRRRTQRMARRLRRIGEA